MKMSHIHRFIQQSKGFDRLLSQVKFLEVSNGSALASMKVTENETNPMQTLHGGFSATLIDAVSSYGLLSLESWASPSVSLNLNLTYMKSAIVGDEIICDSRLVKAGKNVAFLDCEIRNAKDNAVLVKAMHSKYLLKSHGSK